jgi:predicted RNase H-like HicB family nuclease
MHEHHTYTIWLRWNEDHQGYLAEVPELPTVEGSGKTYEEALASVLEAIRWWQEMTTRQAIPPAQPESEAPLPLLLAEVAGPWRNRP